jgi:hypothetical protein
MNMQLCAPHSNGSTSDGLSVGVCFVGVTSTDFDLQDQEGPTTKTATETGGDQIERNEVVPELEPPRCGTEFKLR